jgi:hypothetical protein
MGIEVRTVVRLSDRETRFVESLAHGLRPTKAAAASGYSICHARRLLGKQHVAAALRSICSNVQAAVAICDQIALAGD